MKIADFSGKKKLARHVTEVASNGRPAPPAFRKARANDRLSVNSLTVETERQIAAAYARKWNGGQRPVSMAVCTVEMYVQNAAAVGIELTPLAQEKNWQFVAGGSIQLGFAHTSKDWSDSHCECNFTESFSDFQDFRFAQRMAGALMCKKV